MTNPPLPPTALSRSWTARDGYAIRAVVWPVPDGVALRGRVLVLHGVQSHAGWYHGLGRTLATRGFEAHFTDRRGSGSNRADRGHTPSARHLRDDVAGYLTELRATQPPAPQGLAGISWGGKLAAIAAADRPDLIDAVALICPGLAPSVGVALGEKLRIAWAFATNPRRAFPIPLNDPALFTDSPEGRAFIANDPLGLRAATASTLAASIFLDRRARGVPPRLRQPSLLMLADRDRIIDNVRTLAFWKRVAASDKTLIRYPEGHHTLEFDPDPTRYARDLADWLDAHLPAIDPPQPQHQP